MLDKIKSLTVFLRNNVEAIRRYSFLIKQLVLRDFRVRYKRSVLGILWSMLNPLLTSFVLNFIFSTIFKQQIEHYIVYVMAGFVVFNYYSETTNQAMLSIVGNKALITKVYIPKYIFPLSKVLSSAINFVAALAALLIVILFNGLRINAHYLLLPILFLSIMLFTFGMSCILSVLTVFFDDTRFLYSVVLVLWTYATPIMYPAEILNQYQMIMNFNPLYHYITFFRDIVLYDAMPSIKTVVICYAVGLVVCVLGLLLFKKTQDKFILHI